MQTIAHKIELAVNNKQGTYFAKACGVARVAYNWGLFEWKRMYESGEKPNEAELRKKLNSIKKSQFPYMLEVTKCAPQLAIKDDLATAFKRFFSKQSGYPKPRKKFIHDRFHISNDQFDIKDNYIRIPKLGWVKMHETLRYHGKVLSATISRVADKWFVSITVEVDDTNIKYPNNQMTNKISGVDLGITTFATIVSDDGTVKKHDSIKPYKTLLTQVKRLSRQLSRKQKKSKNRTKARYKLAKMHARISNIRNDYVEKVTTELANNNSHIVLENLNVRGMSKNRKLAKSILDMGFYNFKSRLEAKLKARNKQLMIADRWFASSKLCSTNGCGYLYRDMTLKDRMWDCPNCNVTHDRDVNSARNLMNLAVSSTVSACGVSSDGGTLSNQWSTSHVMLKQEFNHNVVQNCNILHNIV
jgi:putative transposase